MNPNAELGLGAYAYAFAVSGTFAMIVVCLHFAAIRRALSWADRAMVIVLVAALTVAALTSVFAHDYGRAIVCALLIALHGAAMRAALTRAPVPGHAACACPNCQARRRGARGPRPYH